MLLPVKQSVAFMQQLQANAAMQQRIKGVLVDDTGGQAQACCSSEIHRLCSAHGRTANIPTAQLLYVISVSLASIYRREERDRSTYKLSGVLGKQALAMHKGTFCGGKSC